MLQCARHAQKKKSWLTIILLGTLEITSGVGTSYTIGRVENCRQKVIVCMNPQVHERALPLSNVVLCINVYLTG